MTLEELYRLLRSSHVQAQGIVDTLQEPLVVLDKAYTVISANPAFYKTFKTERENSIGQTLFELGNGQWDIPDLRTLLAEVVPRAAAIVGYEVEHDFPDLGRRTMLVSARTLSHPDSNSTQMLVVFEDITERRKADAAKDILVGEMRHRMKNLMAMVRAVARQTETQGRTSEEYRDVFMGRFEAILTAQEFIMANGLTTDLSLLIAQSVEPLAGSRLQTQAGPTVELNQHQVMPVSMILHELATNAVKYGALSGETGRVHIEWNAERQEGRSRLMLDWREVGGPPVRPPVRRGFGTQLIDYSCKADGGNAVFDFDPAGFKAHITLPLQTE